jgi:hypothetical protein
MLLLPAACAGLTRLCLGSVGVVRANDVLPPNLLELSVCRAAVASILPLLHLKQLTLQYITWDFMPAAELRQLSALTSLTRVDLSYYTSAQQIDAAADCWCALPLQHLSLCTRGGDSLQHNTLMHLSKLTRLSSLTLGKCVSSNSMPPEVLGDVLAQLTRLTALIVTMTQQQQQQLAEPAAGLAGDAAAAAWAAQDAATGSFLTRKGFLTRLLHRLAGSLPRMQLSVFRDTLLHHI